MAYTIKTITPLETHTIRHPILRPGKPINSCIFDGDDLKSTIHLGVYLKQQLIGVCSLLKNENDLLTEEQQYQLRGMAILKDYQGKGLGHTILKHAESTLKKNNTNLIWCNARKIAVPFYKKNGYHIIGKPFNIETIGQHFMMYKKL